MSKRISILALVVALPLTAGSSVFAGEMLTAQTAFDQLAALAGDWSGAAAGSGNAEAEAESGHAVLHVFELSAANTVVMETMNPDSDHEMINMYHLDGDDLVMTHYCAGGNQPTMKVKFEESSADHLVFEFTGGTNLDAGADHHIHDASIRWNEDGSLLSSWRAFGDGEPVGDMVFTLTRAEG